MMGRLPGFDYKRPFFYMVTIKGARSGSCKVAFSRISEAGEVEPTGLTPAFEGIIRHFHETWYCIEPIRYYVIMPDHLHLIIKMRGDVEKRVSLAVVVRQLIKALERSVGAERQLQNQPERQLQNQPERQLQNQPERQLQNPVLQAAAPPPLIEHEWHDWIVKKEGQLAAFRKYILENPPRHARRRANRRFFTQAREIVFQGRRYWAYGNEALLELPVIVAIKGHRRGRESWRGAPTAKPAAGGDGAKPGFASGCSAAALLLASSRIGPGGAGLSTFLSPLEKDAGNEIVKAGGVLIVLSMTGFGERWHPTEKQERLCAAGRMLYLSPYPPQAAKLTKKEMYIRAHELVDWAIRHSHYHMEAWPS